MPPVPAPARMLAPAADRALDAARRYVAADVKGVDVADAAAEVEVDVRIRRDRDDHLAGVRVQGK